MNATDPFEAIVHEHYQLLYRFAMSLTRSESDACDLTQQTFYVWATKGHQLRDVTKVKSWLYTTLHRAFLQGRRRQSRFPQQELDAALEQLPAAAPVLADQVDALQVLPALARVDEVYQAAVALFYLEDYAYKDIAGRTRAITEHDCHAGSRLSMTFALSPSDSVGSRLRGRFGNWNGSIGSTDASRRAGHEFDSGARVRGDANARPSR
jgi:RNA polymerase sigma factor (sigma-70 family)